MGYEISKTNALNAFGRSLTIALAAVVLIAFWRLNPNFRAPQKYDWALVKAVWAKIDDFQLLWPFAIAAIFRLYQALFMAANSWHIIGGQVKIEKESFFGSRISNISRYEIKEAKVEKSAFLTFVPIWHIKLTLKDGGTASSPEFFKEEDAIEALALLES